MKSGLRYIIIGSLLSLFTQNLYNTVSPENAVRHNKENLPEYKELFTNEFINPEIIAHAINGFNKIKKEHKINDSILTIIDYSKPSTEERIFVVDIKNNNILSSALVAHGKSTGVLFAENFSNNPKSHQSCLGFFITVETYFGKHGYSLRMQGIEKGINDNAYKRSIVIHGANYVSSNYIDKYGRIGRSFGCPALPQEKNKQIIDLIKNQTCIFIYGNHKEYLSSSRYSYLN
ncbi:MAG: murein L,D-transpeptidase catalytic domain family protein [Bacteroidales bacterium]|nr:murein L,D-transpeptidase catalytic domain family protein [Bacteroidales bacterium]